MRQISDPDVQILAGLSTTIAPDYARAADDPWLGSPFQWILSVPPATRGAIGESLVAEWCEAQGFDVLRSPNSEADRSIHGHRIEIKFSTLWKTGIFRFQQIREQNYDYVFCIGSSPSDAQAWLLPKRVLREYVIGHMGQHTGAGASDTDWLGFPAQKPYPWMAPYGGRLGDVARLIARNGKGPYEGYSPAGDSGNGSCSCRPRSLRRKRNLLLLIQRTVRPTRGSRGRRPPGGCVSRRRSRP